MPDHQRAQNSILAALPAADWAPMRSSFQETPLRLGDILAEANAPFDHVHFSVLGVVSSVAIMENGASVEMATVGAEGAVGIDPILGSQEAAQPTRCSDCRHCRDHQLCGLCPLARCHASLS
jgi:hypothetical protein